MRIVSLVLTLAGRRLLVDGPQSFVERIVAEMTPTCVQAPAGADADWRLMVCPGPAHRGSAGDHPELRLRPGGPAVTIMENTRDRLRVAGRYRRHSTAVCMEARLGDHVTRVMPSSLDDDQMHWALWLAKVFFASRLLADGWRMVHASAVAVRGRALMILAPSRGGKSVLAHLVCRDLGVGFLADDLVLLGPDGTVAGWPTRVCLPPTLVPQGVGRRDDDAARPRVILQRPEHRALGIDHSGPCPIGAVIHVRGANGHAVAPSLAPSGAQRPGWAAAERIPVQRMYTSDLLGLTGGPAVTGRPVPLSQVLSDVVEVELVTQHPIGPEAVEALAALLPSAWARHP